MRQRRQSGPPSVRAAVLKFALGGLAATLVLVGVTALAFAGISREEAVKDAKRLTELVGRQIVEPRLTDGVLRQDPKAIARFDRVIRSGVRRGDFVRVKLWRPDGRIVYSDEPRLRGVRFRLDHEEREVLATGGVEAEVSDLSGPENRYERGGGDLLEVYLPVQTPSGRRAMFETYLRLSSVTASGRDLWASFIPALLGALVVLQLIQLPLARSLARRVEQAHRDRMELLQRAVDASDLERRRIAADLHDGTVQDLVAASYALTSARERLGPDGNGASTALERADETTRGAVRELRSLLVDIYPPRLREAGLASALRDLCPPLEERGLRTHVDVSTDLQLPHDVTALLYRTAQEAMRNAAEHAEAQNVRVQVRASEGTARLSVADDGVGFDHERALAAAAEGHFGLRLLRDQVRDAGGTFELDSAPGRGTRVGVEVPLA
ncbi:MAG TPA: sensor histidine kinase [Thermoleophilaceae bacterium]|nr:sensor histidine kinase [Thermoleophilaceae bacterium]